MKEHLKKAIEVLGIIVVGRRPWTYRILAAPLAVVIIIVGVRCLA